MTDNPPFTVKQADAILGWCVLFLQAGQRRDEATMDLLLNTAPAPVDYVPALIGIANKLGYLCHGRDAFASLVGQWEPGQGIPGVHRPPWPMVLLPQPESTPASRAVSAAAAVGIVSALIQTEHAADVEWEQLTAAAACLMPDLYTDGVASGAVALARVAETAVRRAAHAEGKPVDEVWQELAQHVNNRQDRGE